MEFDFLSLSDPRCSRCNVNLVSGNKYFFSNGRLYCGRECYTHDGCFGPDFQILEILVEIDKSCEPSAIYPDDPLYLKIAKGLFRGKDFG